MYFYFIVYFSFFFLSLFIFFFFYFFSFFSFQILTRSGKVTTNENRDFTVKVVVKGLKSNTRYFYGFSTDDAHSIVGMTRTTPSTSDGDVPLNIGLFSCSNWRSGYFHAYTLAASSDDLDLWLHVGD